jgi:hypothetical protein
MSGAIRAGRIGLGLMPFAAVGYNENEGAMPLKVETVCRQAEVTPSFPSGSVPGTPLNGLSATQKIQMSGLSASLKGHLKESPVRFHLETMVLLPPVGRLSPPLRA